jgi:poly-beta-hydroxyalkanoate depolymerase
MIDKVQNWNVIIRSNYGYPMKPQKEFKVMSKTHLGAAMIAKKILKKYHSSEWHISSVYWLDPNSLNRE